MVSANPFKACCTSEYEMLLLNYNMLYGFSAEDSRRCPELTPGCEPSTDYMTWTCPIRDDVSWHDGEPLTAEDIAFTYRFTLDNGLTTFSDYLPFNPTFETPDPYTLVWHSEEPTLAPTVPPYIPILPNTSGVRSTASRQGDPRLREIVDAVPDRSSSGGSRDSSGAWRRSGALLR